MILAIDPGTTESGWVCMKFDVPVDSGVVENDRMRDIVLNFVRAGAGNRLAIEMIASYGMPVGAEVFETCLWIGRFVEIARFHGITAELIYRRDVKMHLCANARAKDGNIRQALLDLIGPQGTKKAPGPTYGIKSHAWAALAVAATALNMQPNRRAA
jgi:hypothetical protein